MLILLCNSIKVVSEGGRRVGGEKEEERGWEL